MQQYIDGNLEIIKKVLNEYLREKTRYHSITRCKKQIIEKQDVKIEYLISGSIVC